MKYVSLGGWHGVGTREIIIPVAEPEEEEMIQS